MANASGAIARAPKVLFFINDMVPTQEQRDKAATYKGASVAFRNARSVSNLAHSSLEECDAVAGAVPDRYAAVYPNAEDLTGERMNRMSDYDLRHGLPTELDNEAARAAKPPSVGATNDMLSGATRTPGAITAPQGGFVAPVPGNPAELPYQGSERAENAPQGSVRPAGGATNPHALPAGGVSSVGENGGENLVSAGTVAQDPPGSGFTALKPVEPPKETAAEKKKREAAEAEAAKNAGNK